MAYRIPRGFATNRPAYLELCEGQRPNVSALPLEAWTGLAPIRIDDVNHDPIVLEPGTIVGIATGATAFSGKLLPAMWATGGATTVAGHPQMIFNYHHSDGATWGLPTTTTSGTVGVVKPIGVVFQPIYSFNLQAAFTNYKRNVNVGVVTDYVIQVPCVTANEHAIENGDLVMVAHNAYETGVFANIGASSGFTSSRLAGRYQKFDPTLSAAGYLAHSHEMVVGRCLKKVVFCTASGSSSGDLLQDRIIAGATITLSTEATAEFTDLAKVQTVPGLVITGSGTSGIPGHLLGARANSTGFAYLTLLIRL